MSRKAVKTIGNIPRMQPWISRPVPPQVKYYVNKRLRQDQEKRYVITNMPAVFNLLSTSWTEQDLSSVSTGSTISGREGRIQKITSFEAKFTIHSVDSPNNTYRMVLGLYSGTQTTPLQSAGITMNNILTPVACRNFLIKKYIDKYITVNTANESDRYIKIYKKFKHPISIHYGDDTTSYPDKKLMIAIISDSGSASHPFVSYGYGLTRFEP